LPFGDVSTEQQLNNAYKKEIDSDVKERILLIRRVRMDSQKEASKVAERELYKSRWWRVYKWLIRFDEHGIDGLKGHPSTEREITTNSTKKGW
jgi:hypothetical protein